MTKPNYAVSASQGNARYWVRIAREFIHPQEQLRHSTKALRTQWQDLKAAQSVAAKAAALRPDWAYEAVEC